MELELMKMLTQAMKIGFSFLYLPMFLTDFCYIVEVVSLFLMEDGLDVWFK